MKQLLKDIQNRIMDQVKDIKYVDIDWGQLDYYNPHPPVKWPCALIDIQNVQWSNVGNLGQMGIVTIAITLADLRLSNTSGRAPAGQRENALKIWEIIQETYKALHGWTGQDYYSALIRSSNSYTRRDDGVQLHQIVFTTEIKDDTALIKRDKTEVEPKLKLRLR